MKSCFIFTLLCVAVTQTLCNDVWIPVFMGFSGNGKEVYNTWKNSAINDNILKQYGLNGNQKHLRNGFIDDWKNVKMVKVELLDSNNNLLVWLTFNGKGTTNTNWFSKANLMGSSFHDLVPSSCGSMNFFAMEGEIRHDSSKNTSLDRRFFINRSYAGCDEDYGWLVVVDTFKTCPWEKKGSVPLFMYTENDALNRNWKKADDLDKLSAGDVDQSKVEQVLNRKPGVIFNLPELISAILQDDDFIDRITPKMTDSIWSRFEKKFEEKCDSLLTNVIKPMQEKIDKQDELIKTQNVIIKKQVDIVHKLEKDVAKQKSIIETLDDTVSDLEHQVLNLDQRLDEQEQYSRRTSLRFHNVPCPDARNLRKMDTDTAILNICNDILEVPITLNDIGRTHPIGKIKNGKVQVIVRFLSYRNKNAVFGAKKKLKGNRDHIFITENLTQRRQQIMNELNYLRYNKKINTCWSNDGRIFAIPNNSTSVRMITRIDDIYSLVHADYSYEYETDQTDTMSNGATS